jgi:hypothetical protein
VFLIHPVELLERLAALTPRPRINLVLHHGVLAPHSRWRARAVAYRGDTPAPVSHDAALACGTTASPVPPSPPGAAGGLEASSAPQLDPAMTIEGQPSALASSSPAPGPAQVTLAADDRPSRARQAWSWPNLLRHTFAVDVLACPRCGGRIRVVATIEDPVVIRKILTHLGLPTDVPAPRPPPSDLFDWS